MAEHFTRFSRKKQASYWLKQSTNSKKTTRLTTFAIWRTFAVLNSPLSPKLADKHVFENEINIDGGKHILACF